MVTIDTFVSYINFTYITDEIVNLLSYSTFEIFSEMWCYNIAYYSKAL